MTFVSEWLFYWLVIAMVFGIAAFTLVRDAYLLRRHRRLAVAKRPPDQAFGFIIGIGLAIAGLFGLVKHFAGW